MMRRVASTEARKFLAWESSPAPKRRAQLARLTSRNHAYHDALDHLERELAPRITRALEPLLTASADRAPPTRAELEAHIERAIQRALASLWSEP